MSRVRFPLGSPQNPMSVPELENKFRELSAGFIEPQAQEQLIKRMRGLESVGDVTEVTELISSDGQST